MSDAVISAISVIVGVLIGNFGKSILENKRAKNDKKIYVNKVRFDTEFSIYKELNCAFFEMVKKILTILPPECTFTTEPFDEEERKKERENNFKHAWKATVTAQDLLKSNYPFIEQCISKQYEEILNLCIHQLNIAENTIILFQKPNDITYDDKKRSQEIMDKYGALNTSLREYLSKIEIR